MTMFDSLAKALVVSAVAAAALTGCAAPAAGPTPAANESETETETGDAGGGTTVADDTTGVCVVATPAEIGELFGAPATSEERRGFIGTQANGEQLVGAMCQWFLDDVQLDLTYIAANEFAGDAVECTPPVADEVVDVAGVGSTAWWGRSVLEGTPVGTLRVCTPTALVIGEITGSETDDADLQAQVTELVERLLALE